MNTQDHLLRKLLQRLSRGSSGLDQLVNSSSSALYTIGTALILTDVEFGAVALQLVAMAFMLGVVRAALFEGALFLLDSENARPIARLLVRVGLAAAVITSVAMVAIGSLATNQSAQTTWVTAFVGFVVLTLDGVRYGAFVTGQAPIALVTDAAWLAATLVGALAFVFNNNFSYITLSISYCVAGILSTGLGSAMLRRSIGSGPTASIVVLRRQARFTADLMLQMVPPQLVLVFAPAVVGLGGLGLFRAVSTLYQPLATGIGAIRLAILSGHSERDSLDNSLRRAVPVIGAVGVVYVAFAIFFTTAAPVLSRGSLTRAGSALIIVYGFAEIARAIIRPTFDRARLAEKLKQTLQVRATQATVLIGGSVALGILLGTTGLAVARLGSFLIAIPLLRVLRRT